MTSALPSNQLIAALPHRERAELLRHCTPVDLAQDQLLHQRGEVIERVYFPIDSFIVLVAGFDPHDTLGLELIGREGMLGASLALGIDQAPLLARVSGSGRALRMDRADFQQLLQSRPLFERHIQRYLYSVLAHLAQTAVCAVFHRVDARLAYWLLMIDDRVAAHDFHLTHDRLAKILGVRRSGVSTAASALQAQGFITYSRGHVRVLNRQGLEGSACGCYRAGRIDLTETNAETADSLSS